MTPSAAKTSAAPDFDEKARLPCFATGTPQPATTSALAVEMLKEPAYPDAEFDRIFQQRVKALEGQLAEMRKELDRVRAELKAGKAGL